MLRAALLLVAAALAAVPAAAQRPIADWAQLPFVVEPQLSPDGKRVAARLTVAGKQRLAIVKLDDLAAPPVVIASDIDINDWDWVNNDWLVAAVGDSQPLGARSIYFTRAIGISADGRTINRLGFGKAAQQAGDVIWRATDGTPRILLKMQRARSMQRTEFWPAVQEVDVSTGRFKLVVPSTRGISFWYADASGFVRMGIGSNAKTVRLLHRAPGAKSFRTVERANPDKDEKLTIPRLFLADPTRAVVSSDKDGFDALYEYDLTTLTIGKRVFGTPGHDVGGLIHDAKGTGLAGVSYVSDRARVEWLDPGLAAVQTDLDRSVGPQRVARIVSMSRDRGRMIVLVGAVNQPGTYYFYDRSVGRLRQFGYASLAMKAAPMGPVSTIAYKARDGMALNAVLTLPQGRAATNLPLILMPHGGPAARDAERYDWIAQFLADRGYAVVQPNYRGSTGFGEALFKAGEGEWGLKMQDDINDAVAAVVARGIADPKRVCVLGISYGGYAAMRAAQRDGASFRCAVSYAGVSDLERMTDYNEYFLFGLAITRYLEKQAPDFRSVSPLFAAGAFATPMLLMHGKMDMRVPVYQSREMAEKLKAAGKPVRYVEQKLGDHFLTREADRVEFLSEVETFLKAHNPA